MLNFVQAGRRLEGSLNLLVMVSENRVPISVTIQKFKNLSQSASLSQIRSLLTNVCVVAASVTSRCQSPSVVPRAVLVPRTWNIHWQHSFAVYIGPRWWSQWGQTSDWGGVDPWPSPA